MDIREYQSWPARSFQSCGFPTGEYRKRAREVCAPATSHGVRKGAHEMGLRFI